MAAKRIETVLAAASGVELGAELREATAALEAEEARLAAECDRLRELLIRDRTAAGRALTAGGRRALLRRFEPALVRRTAVTFEIAAACRRLAIQRDNARTARVLALRGRAA